MFDRMNDVAETSLTINYEDGSSRKIPVDQNPVVLHGRFKLIHFDKDGNILNEFEKDNIICNAGIAKVAGLIGGSSSGGFSHMAVGTGTTAASATDTALGTEVLRVATTNTLQTTTVTDDTIHFVATFSFTASYAITEAGIFDASSGGNILSHQVFSADNVANGDSIQIQWNVQA